MNKVVSVLLYLGISLLVGCAGTLARDQGLALIEQGQYEAGLAQLREAAEANPRDTATLIALANAQAEVVVRLLSQADRLGDAGDYAGAQVNYRRVLGIEPGNLRASEALRRLEQQRNIDEMLRQAQAALRRGDLPGAERQVRAVQALDAG